MKFKIRSLIDHIEFQNLKIPKEMIFISCLSLFKMLMTMRILQRHHQPCAFHFNVERVPEVMSPTRSLARADTYHNRLVGGYVKIKNSQGHSARKKATHQFQGAILRAHYRFDSGLGGFSTLITHTLLSRRVFCCSIMGRVKESDFDRFMFTTAEGVYMM